MSDHDHSECSGTFRNGARTLPASSVPPPLKGGGTEHSKGRYGSPARNGQRKGQPTSADDIHTLYRFYSADGTLLYIGITASPPQRFRAHSKTKTWWNQISDVKLSHFEDRPSLVDAERHAIKNEHPVHNVVHNNPAGQPATPQELLEREWHHLVGQVEELQSRTGVGCATIWLHVKRGEYELARLRLDELLADMSWFGSAAAEDLISTSFHSGGQGPCTCGREVLYFRTSGRYLHADGTEGCFQK